VHMGKRLLILLILTSCASQKPKGNIVRLTAEESEDQIKNIEVLQKGAFEAPAFAQKIAPAKPEEAAVFHFTMANAYSLDNETEKAIESFRAALVHDGGSALLRARLAAELVKVNAFAEAKILCEEAIKIDPKYVDSYLLLAGIQVAAKELEGAIKTYEAALKVDARNRDALLYYGVTLAEVGRIQQSVVQMEKLIALKDKDDSTIDRSVAFYYLAKIQEQAGNRQKAKDALRAALKNRPGFARAALLLADYYGNEKAAAISVLEDTFRENHSGELAERLAEIYLERNSFAKAVVYIETLVEEDPTNENMKLKLSLVYWQLKWFDKARLILQGLMNRYPQSSEIAFYLGELEMERSRLDNALVYYRKVSPDYPKFESMVARVSQLFKAEKDFSSAESFVRDALRKKPDGVQLYTHLASIHEDQNKLEEAKETLEKGYSLFPKDEGILYYLGFIQDRLGEKEKALKYMDKLLVVNPDNANALNFIGYGLLESGRELDRASELLSRAVKIRPQDPFILDSYGWLLYRQGKHGEAMKTLEKAVALKSDEAVILEHLGDVYLALNLRAKAIAVYEKALALGGEPELMSRLEIKRENARTLAKNRTPKKKQDSRLPASAK